MLIRSILPLVACYMLMMSLMLSGSWMLQGTVEERSNKLLETVIACVSPEELMYGKLVGTVGIGLSMIAVWMLCGVGAAYATQGAIADMIRPALDPLNSAGTIATMIYFFVAGYVAIAMFFLAIGAMSDSMRDAQGYLTPVMMAILIPITILIQGILSGGGGVGIEVLTWIPIYTPFAVLARLGSGIPAWEVVTTGILLAAFIAVELVLLGRLFRASLLASGSRPDLKTVLRRMRGVGNGRRQVGRCEVEKRPQVTMDRPRVDGSDMCRSVLGADGEVHPQRFRRRACYQLSLTIVSTRPAQSTWS